MKPEQEAYKLAREMVAEHLTIEDLHWWVLERAHRDPRWRKLLAAICPGYPEVTKELSKQIGYCKTGETPNIEELHWREVNAYTGAAFALGFSAGMQLKVGKQE